MNFIPNFGPDKSTKDRFTKIGNELESLSGEIGHMSGFNADFKPDEDTKEELKNAEDELTSLDHEKKVMEVLLGYGLIGRDEQIDLDALFKKQKSITQKYAYVSDEAAAALAYLDTQVVTLKQQGASVDEIIGLIPEGLVISLLTNKVARNDKEFISTIFKNLERALTSSQGDFSEVLLSTISARQASFAQGVMAIVDGRTNVVITPSERESLIKGEIKGGDELH
jgi:hypothetical protein